MHLFIDPSIVQLYQWRHIYVASMHHKEQIIWPLLQEHLHLSSCTSVPQINTDQFGTFSGTIKRIWSMIETLNRKILYARQLTQSDLIVASEGSFGNHPSFPGQITNMEIILMQDFTYNYTFVGRHITTQLMMKQWSSNTLEHMQHMIQSRWRPEQWIIIRHQPRWNVTYDTSTTNHELEQIYRKHTYRPRQKRIHYETDMRAHRNPVRAIAIHHATQSLLQCIGCQCSHCGAPWFDIHHTVYDRHCSHCWSKTTYASHDIRSCQSCFYTESRPITQDPTAIYGCSQCNP